MPATATPNANKLKQLQSEVWRIFKGRCGMNPAHKASGVHEIVPKSHGKKSLSLENMIPLCQSCHEKYQSSAPAMIKKIVRARERTLRILRPVETATQNYRRIKRAMKRRGIVPIGYTVERKDSFGD
jgi:hypothetical protein